MATPFVGPMGDVPSEWQMTENPPSNHWQSSVVVSFPPGPMGLGFISPSLVHLPTKNPSFLCSGPGLGASCDGPACMAAKAWNPPPATRTHTANTSSVLLMAYLLSAGARILPTWRSP